jgi:type VI secretion system protein ImpC
MGRAATANENLSARLSYLLAVSRAAHALQPMLRIQLGKSKEASEIEEFLHNWFNRNYVAETTNEEIKAKKPFRSAEIKVTEDEKDPGVYHVKTWLRPHFQVEEINVRISLVARPLGKG